MSEPEKPPEPHVDELGRTDAKSGETLTYRILTRKVVDPGESFHVSFRMVVAGQIYGVLLRWRELTGTVGTQGKMDCARDVQAGELVEFELQSTYPERATCDAWIYVRPSRAS